MTEPEPRSIDPRDEPDLEDAAYEKLKPLTGLTEEEFAQERQVMTWFDDLSGILDDPQVALDPEELDIINDLLDELNQLITDGDQEAFALALEISSQGDGLLKQLQAYRTRIEDLVHRKISEEESDT